jgi:nucleotide-binding universal stress UspA family protein
MNVRRVLLCMDGSPAALAAARLAIGLADEWHVPVRAISVIRDSGIAARLDLVEAGRLPPAEQRAANSALGVLGHVADLAREHRVELETVLLTGEPSEMILREAADYRPDLIAIGRLGRRGPRPAVGSVTEQLLEFTEWPVLVVPAPNPDHRSA